MPKIYVVPEGLRTFLNSVKSEVCDPRNRNAADCNLPINELMTLKDLIQLQKDRVIVVRACDKGAGIMLLDFEDYLRACYNHLTAETTTVKPYYSPVNALDVENAKQRIIKVFKEGLATKIITQAE